MHQYFSILALAVAALIGAAGCARAARPTPRDEVRGAVPEREAGAARTYLGEGLASYYGPGLAGRPTASGERFNPQHYTAAHRTLRFGTCVRVVNMENGKSARVRVNDRGPYVDGRIIDVSLAAAHELDMKSRGVVRVRLYRCEGT